MNTVSSYALLSIALLTLTPLLTAPAYAAAPSADDVVIETLPSSAASARERALRSQLQAQPQDVGSAVALAQSLLARSRAEGDARYAGRALAALQPWPDADTAPPDVLLARANVQQYLHDFAAARGNLQRLVQRQPGNAQAWLILATLHRLQGRYAESTAACEAVGLAGAGFHALACAAENQGLLGQTSRARTTLRRLLANPERTLDQRAWLLTTLAELEDRSSRPVAAERAYKEALALSGDPYARVSYADFLLQQDRAADALAVLASQPRSDAVLLRLTLAEQRLHAPLAAQDLSELTRRMTQNPINGQERLGHAREQAMFALWLQHQPQRALEFARANLTLQREPVDLLLMAEAARAGKQAQALKEVAQLKQQLGLHDERLDALL